MRLPVFCVFATLFALLCNAQTISRDPLPVREIRYLMGTMCEVTVYPTNGDVDSRDAIAAAFEELHRIERLLSSWSVESVNPMKIPPVRTSAHNPSEMHATPRLVSEAVALRTDV